LVQPTADVSAEQKNAEAQAQSEIVKKSQEQLQV